MSRITSKKEAVEMLFQELYESGTEIWADTIHECLLYLADDAEAFNIVEALNEDYEAKEIQIIHKCKADKIVKEGLEEVATEIRYKLLRHYALIEP